MRVFNVGTTDILRRLQVKIIYMVVEGLWQVATGSTGKIWESQKGNKMKMLWQMIGEKFEK